MGAPHEGSIRRSSALQSTMIYIYICIHVCMYVRVYMYVCGNVYNVCTYICMYVHVCECIHTYIKLMLISIIRLNTRFDHRHLSKERSGLFINTMKHIP